MGHLHEKIDWVVCAYIVNDGKVLLIKHKQLGKWLPIGGHVELDEDPEQALYREIKEESDLEVELFGSAKPSFKDAAHCKPLPAPVFLDIHDINAAHKHIGLTYFARAKSNKVKLADKEHDDIRWFSVEDMKKEKLIPENVRFYSEQALKINDFIEKSKMFLNKK